MPLQSFKLDQPFEKWGIDFVGPIITISNTQVKFLIVSIGYVTKWAK